MAGTSSTSKDNDSSPVDADEKKSFSIVSWLSSFPFFRNYYLKLMIYSAYLIGITQILFFICTNAYKIRLHAINEYGRVIHEFDPYFNWRATQYLYENGWEKFTKWFDYKVWYPLGRPVGTTIYPGMQVTSVFIKNWIMGNAMSLNDVCVFVPAWFGVIATVCTGLITYECSIGISSGAVGSSAAVASDDRGIQHFTSILNHIPIINVIYNNTFPPLCRILMSLLVKLTGSSWGLQRPSPSKGASSSSSETPSAPLPRISNMYSSPAIECGLCAAFIMSIVPAHLMRSVGGGYDNESVAITAMTFTFFCWTRSLRGGNTPTFWNYFFALLSGIAYLNMVASWGGYVFVLNLIGVHASVLVLLGRYSFKLYVSYTSFYAVGTTLAISLIPVVGYTPIKSLEQIGPLLAFGGFQLIQLCEVIKHYKKLDWKQTWKVRFMVFGIAAIIAALISYFILLPTGYFGPISSRVRGLFVKHTKTGNPLVDSVAEHQAASTEAYFQYLHNSMYLAPIGFGMVALFFFSDSSSFLLVYGVAAYYFSHKMVRLVLLTAPICSILGGLALGRIFSYGILGSVFGDYNKPSLMYILLLGGGVDDEDGFSTNELSSSTNGTTVVADVVSPDGSSTKKKQSSASKKKKSKDAPATTTPVLSVVSTSKSSSPSKDIEHSHNIFVRIIRFVATLAAIKQFFPMGKSFYDYCWDMSARLSHPSIIQKGTTKDGRVVTVDDYREAYWWLRDNTPEDARIMAWWDYGYQITGISNRTTIADGNTWNHEHIALLGRALTSSEKEGHRIARHMADYVLVWTGGGGDDLAKSPHLRRIANSVYRNICPHDPTCSSFGFTQRGPTPELAGSLLYKLHSHQITPGVEVDKNRFRHVYISTHGKVRIYKVMSVSKESKEWVADPKNRLCDAPGSWFCPGQYPPGLQKILKEKKDFRQLEDFNVDKEHDEEYTKKYFDNLNDPNKARQAHARQQQQQQQQEQTTKKKIKKLDQSEINEINSKWENSDLTTLMWELISSNNVDAMKDYFREAPQLPHIRSEDGRGPMWWAHEYGQTRIIKILQKLGVSESLKDGSGKTPLDLSK